MRKIKELRRKRVKCRVAWLRAGLVLRWNLPEIQRLMSSSAAAMVTV